MAVTDVVSLDEFVDLYKILEIPQTASENELRERVNKLYLEAQRNLDHHNFRKRFYYQQLYEIHLPQAHQLLLNQGQRNDYDRYLDAFNKGIPFPDEASEPSGEAMGGDLGRADGLSTDVLPTTGAQSAAPAAPPKSESKTTFSFEKTPPAPSVAQPAKTARSATPSGPASAPPAAQTAAAPKEGGSVAQAASARPAPVWKRQVLVDASEMERRRDYKRRELIKGELVAAGLTWGWGIGIGSLVVLGAIFFIVLTQMKMTSATNIVIGGFALVAAIATVAGRYALREARRRIVVVLSKMPYDELLRRCAK